MKISRVKNGASGSVTCKTTNVALGSIMQCIGVKIRQK